ncbi:MAG: NAD(+) synthase [Candidatus Latescibacteria bacterium]|nr:NAD(+) synthase [Candidatus Latescibacterota bacterium]
MTDVLPEIALVQMDVKPARPDLNVERMLRYIDSAREAGAELVVFSELCISGYILGDLWEVDALVEDFAAFSETIREASRDMVVLFGNVAVDRANIGEDGRIRKYNAVYVCADGRYVAREDVPAGLPAGVQPKTLHPNYRFFDDDRHFYSLRKLADDRVRSVYDWTEPFEVRLRDGRTFRFGVQLCEDIWCQDYGYERDVLDTLRVFHDRGAQALFNLSSSPWTWQKNVKRNRVVREILTRSPLPVFYCNHVGAQNSGKNIIVFDGDTTVYSPEGDILRRARPWREQMVLTRNGDPPAASQDEIAAICDAILTGLRHLDDVRERENRFLVGVSGGVDSSVVVSMLVQAFGAERVFAVNMPTRFNASITQENARQVCRTLEVDFLSCPIQDLYEYLSDKIKGVSFSRTPGDYSRLVDENLQARIRGADILPALAAKFGLVFTNNGNKTETALGYATLYGDVNGAVAPIADLYKVQVLQLARFLNGQIFGREVIPGNLISGETVPSAELSEAQDVTRGLGDPIKYGYHDAMLRQIIEYRKDPADFLHWFVNGVLLEEIGWNDREKFRAWFPDVNTWIEDLEWIARQVRVNYFKRVQAPPIIVLSKRAFGFDLRESQLPAYETRRYGELKALALSMEIT